MVTITVDGIEVQVDEKKNLIDALKEQGIEIPHFCYHSKLKVVGMCRICLIEIEGVPKFQVACNTPVKEGMKINASGEKVLKAREGVMEFLLINHPLDCPVCDKAGECRLQNYSFSVGGPTTRYGEVKRNIPQEKIGTNLLINHNRCILCYRCVRFDRDIVGIHDLEMMARGNDTIIAYTPEAGSTEKVLNHNYQGALADICPVGALLNENTLFQSRVWWYEQNQTICHGCSTLCHVTANVKNNEIYRYMPPENPEKNGYFICDHGRFSTKDFAHERLLTYSHNGNKIKGNELISILADKLLTANKILLLGGATESNEDIIAITKFISELKSRNKQITAEYRVTNSLFQNAGEQADFLLSYDQRPNVQNTKANLVSSAKDMNTLNAEVQSADLVIVANELSAPFSYRTEEPVTENNSFPSHRSVEETELYSVLDTAGAWSKTMVLSTHENTATRKAMASLPVLAFPEKTATFTDKEGNSKQAHMTIKPVSGLKSSGEIFALILQEIKEPAMV